MDLDSLKSLFEGFDIAAFLPELTTILGWVETLLRLTVMAAPLLLLGFGLLYLLAPPKEANYSLGFRCWWGMSSLDAWQFTQKIAGMIWSVLGLILTVVMLFVTNGFAGMEVMDLVWKSVTCLVWEAVLALIATLAVNLIAFFKFDRKGEFRGRKAT